MMNNEKHRYEELSDFLKTRRAKVSPSQAGILTTTRRRTPGLRREEVAQLAGIGLTWYTWLEQGRPIQVSPQIIESLSRVLLLDKQERIHLYLLTNNPIPTDISGDQEIISPALWQVLDNLSICPSLITNQRWDVLAWNKAACLMFGDFSNMNQRERNIVWSMFTDNKYRDLLVDWPQYAKRLLGRFRASCGKYIEDSWFIKFIEDLKLESPDFNAWWPLHEIESNGEKYKQLNHQIAGILDFEVSNFDVSDNSGLKLIVHTPLSGTDTAEKMRSLLL